MWHGILRGKGGGAVFNLLYNKMDHFNRFHTKRDDDESFQKSFDFTWRQKKNHFTLVLKNIIFRPFHFRHDCNKFINNRTHTWHCRSGWTTLTGQIRVKKKIRRVRGKSSDSPWNTPNNRDKFQRRRRRRRLRHYSRETRRTWRERSSRSWSFLAACSTSTFEGRCTADPVPAELQSQSQRRSQLCCPLGRTTL